MQPQPARTGRRTKKKRHGTALLARSLFQRGLVSQAIRRCVAVLLSWAKCIFALFSSAAVSETNDTPPAHDPIAANCRRRYLTTDARRLGFCVDRVSASRGKARSWQRAMWMSLNSSSAVTASSVKRSCRNHSAGPQSTSQLNKFPVDSFALHRTTTEPLINASLCLLPAHVHPANHPTQLCVILPIHHHHPRCTAPWHDYLRPRRPPAP
jgi:hypothetical protein